MVTNAEYFARGFAMLCANTVDDVLDAAQVEAGCALLDVGAGTGNVTATAISRGARVTAIDADEAMTVALRRTSPTAFVQRAALPELPFPAGRFDAVTANFVINHVADPLTAMTELRRVLRPGGTVAVTVWRYPMARGQSLLWRSIAAAGIPRPAPKLATDVDFGRDETGLSQLLAQAGFHAVVSRAVSVTHRVDARKWWQATTSVLGGAGQLLAAQAPTVRRSVESHYYRLAAEFAAANGELCLPHAAVLARGRA